MSLILDREDKEIIVILYKRYIKTRDQLVTGFYVKNKRTYT